MASPSESFARVTIDVSEVRNGFERGALEALAGLVLCRSGGGGEGVE